MKPGSKVISIVRGRGNVDVVDVRQPAGPRCQDDDAVGEEDRLGDVVRDEDDRLAALLPEPEQQEVHLVARERVERAERLVEQQHLRVLRERAHDRRALLHAARELTRHRVHELGQSGLLQQRIDARAVDRLPLDLEGELDVLAEVAPGQQVRVLEDHPRLLRPRPVDLRAVEGDAPARERMQAGDRPEQRRLAASARAEDRDQLPLGDVERDVVERVDGAALARVDLRGALDAQLRLHQNQPVFVGIAVLHQLDDGAVDLHERDAKEVVAAAGGVEGLGEDRVPLDRRPEVVDAVGDVGLRCEADRSPASRARSATIRR